MTGQQPFIQKSQWLAYELIWRKRLKKRKQRQSSEAYKDVRSIPKPDGTRSPLWPRFLAGRRRWATRSYHSTSSLWSMPLKSSNPQALSAGCHISCSARKATTAGEDLMRTSSSWCGIGSRPRCETISSSSTQHELPEKIPSCHIALQAVGVEVSRKRSLKACLPVRMCSRLGLSPSLASRSDIAQTSYARHSRWLLSCPPQTTRWLRPVVRT